VSRPTENRQGYRFSPAALSGATRRRLMRDVIWMISNHRRPPKLLFVAFATLAGASYACSDLRKLQPSETPTKAQPSDAFTVLRSSILATDPKTVGIEPITAHPNAWGVLMESQRSGSVISLLSLADGTTSLYFSNGGGIIGAGGNAEVAKASERFVALTESYYPGMSMADGFPLPAAGIIQFYVLTFAGAYTAAAAEDDLVSGKHELSPLFTAGNEVITQIRLHSSEAR